MRGLKYDAELLPCLRPRRTPHGVRGLKYQHVEDLDERRRRTPHGVRGLKYYLFLLVACIQAVAPRMGCVD